MVLKKMENRLERMFERTLTRPFKYSLQPVEIASRIVREIDLSRRLSPQGPLSPNLVRVWIGPDDAERFDGFQKALVSELEESVRQHALAEGYSFLGPVKLEMFIDDDIKGGDLEVDTEFVPGRSEPRLTCSDGRSFTVSEDPISIGRSPQATVTVNDSNVSRQHAEVWRTADGVAVRDLQSTNGTFVNGHRIQAVSLTPRDEIVIGPLSFRIEVV